MVASRSLGEHVSRLLSLYLADSETCTLVGSPSVALAHNSEFVEAKEYAFCTNVE